MKFKLTIEKLQKKSEITSLKQKYFIKMKQSENFQYLYRIHLSMLYFWCHFLKILIIILNKAVLFKEKSSNAIKKILKYLDFLHPN